MPVGAEYVEYVVRHKRRLVPAPPPLTEAAAARNVPAHDLRVTGSWATLGKLPIDFLEKLLHTWRHLYTEVRKTITPDAEAPGLFVLAPARGSFVVRVLVDASATELETEARTVDAIATAVRAIPELSLPGGGETAAREYAALFRLAGDQNVDLEVGMAVPGPARLRHRIRFGRVRGAAMAQPQASPITDVAPTRVVVGILDGANHRTGRFDMHAEDAASIAGQVAKGGKALLLNKVIGETYEFELRSTVDSAGGEPKWELLRLRALAGSALTTTMRTTREVLAAIPRVLPKAIVPQGTLARVIQVVEIVASGKVLSAETIDLSQRHIDYHKQAARVLLLLDDDGTLLLAGATLVALPNVRRLAHLAIQFEVSVVGRAWMKWAGVTGLTELNPDSAEDFLRAKSALDKKSMIERRGRTLREWARELAPHGTPRTNDEAARGKSRVRSADPGPSPAR